MIKPIATAAVVFCFVSTMYGDALDTWTQVSLATNQSFIQIVFGNGQFVAISDLPYMNFNGGGGLSVSSDGLNWSNTVIGGEYSGVAFGNGIFVASQWDPSTDGDAGWTSYGTNGAALANIDFPDGGFSGLYGMSFGTNSHGQAMFVGVGHDYEDDIDTIITSTNGHNWTQQNSGTANEFLTGIVYGQDSFLAVGRTNYPGSPESASVLFSSDGANWEQFGTDSTKIPFLPGAVSCVNNIFYVTGAAITNAYYLNNDGILFAPTNAPYPSIWTPLGSPDGTYVSVNSVSNIYTSTNGINWTKRNTGITNRMSCIAFGNNRFVVGCSDGTLLASGSVAPSVSGQINPATGGLLLTVVGGLVSEATIQASTNLTQWTNLVILSNLSLTDYYLDTTVSNFGMRYYRTVSSE
jgi:hypothetical protein